MKARIPTDATADEGTTNDERASWAEVALLAYGQRTGTVGEAFGDDEAPFLIIGDLLADLAHWCDRHDVDLQSSNPVRRRSLQNRDPIGGQAVGLNYVPIGSDCEKRPRCVSGREVS